MEREFEQVPEPMATRREVDMLRDDLHRMDSEGTRGIGGIQIQMTDLVKDVAELKTEMSARFAAHQRVHDQDHTDRVTGRRWLIGTGVAGLAAMAAVMAMLYDILQHIHR